MPRYAPVMPVDVAKKFRDNYPKQFGDYHLLLAHDVVLHADEYSAVYSDIVGDELCGQPVDTLEAPVVIMDNSVVELGEPMGPGTMMTAVQATNANVVVLPDWLLNAEKTVSATLQGLNTYHAALDIAGDALALPQGSDFKSWVWCLEQFADVDEIGWIGIPKNLNEKLGISRIKALEAVSMICPHKNVHMFGFSDDLWDDIRSTIVGYNLGLAFGIDSAAPIWSGMRDSYKISLGQNIPNKRDGWFDNTAQDPVNRFNLEQAVANCKKVREWLENGAALPPSQVVELLGDRLSYVPGEDDGDGEGEDLERGMN